MKNPAPVGAGFFVGVDKGDGQTWGHFEMDFIKSVGDVIADLEALSGRKLSVKVLNPSGETSHLSLRDQNRLGFAYTDWRLGLRATWNSYQ